MKLIVGLGNPGKDYQDTRHNAGEAYVRELAAYYNAPLKLDTKFYGHVAKANIGNSNVWLLIPNTFMNRSGQSVAALANFYKIDIHHIMVAHDELDIAAGTGKFKHSGGHGGHNGLRDIMSKMANQKDFWRLRIGIGHPGSAKLVSNWVLNKAPKVEYQATQYLIDEAVKVTDTFINGDKNHAIQQLHSIKPN